MLKTAAFVISFFFILIAGCGSKLDITPEEVVLKIEHELKVGVDSSEIEAFLKKEGWPHAYDPFQDRYQAMMEHPEDDYHSISIHIYVNKKKSSYELKQEILILRYKNT